jgi:class 3 adenylate cyclase
MQDDKLPAGSPPSLERRLSTILVADVFGYSRMMQENEERTVEIFRGHREIFDGLLRQHHGRIFNTAGDAVLAEFPSAVEAVRCATEIQTALRTRNEHLPPEQRMFFRIGINLGDVIVQGNDLLGDGVNVAARIQTIAEPGGICLSGSVYDQIRNKLSLQFKQLGERSFKNIAEPIRTFSITDVGDGALPSIPTWRRYAKQRLIAAGMSAIVLIAVAGGYWVYRTHDTQRINEARVAAEKEAGRAAADEARMNVEAQRKAELERTARDATEREAKLRAELLTAQGKAERERIAREAAQREAKLQVEQERIAREAAQREAKLQAEPERIAREAAQREAKLQAEQERIAREAAQREAKLQAELKAAQVELQQAEAAKKQAAQQAAVTAAVPQKAASSAGAGPNRYDGTYQGRICTQDDVGTSAQKCRPAAVTVKQGTVSGSLLAGGSGKRQYLKGTISPEGTVKIALEGFNRKGKPITGAMTGTWSNDTITTSGTWHHNGTQVKATWKREP